MIYECIEDSWEKAFSNGEIDKSIRLIEYQIATNLVNVHNCFSDLKLECPAEAFYLLSYDNVRNDQKDSFEVFSDLQFHFCEVAKYYEESGFSKEDFLNELKNIEKSLREAFDKI